MNKYQIEQVIVTSKTVSKIQIFDGKRLIIVPTSLYCLNIGAATSQAAISERMMAANAEMATKAAE